VDFAWRNSTVKYFSAIVVDWDYHFAATTLFSIVTLPVEYDASNRALAWLENKRMLTPQEQAELKILKMG
jgi:Zn-dependent membrane protease YugP